MYKYLRISVNDKCDLACKYCRTERGVKKRLLSFEDIAKTVGWLTGYGISHVRLTGGEPLLRKDVAGLVEMLTGLVNIETIALTTNGTMLQNEAAGLKSAGLKRINIHIDTLDREKYRYVTGGGDINRALKGIEAALACGINLKLNTVLLKGINDAEIPSLIDFFARFQIPVRFIELMPFCSADFYKRHFLSAGSVLKNVRKMNFEPIEGDFGSGPASYYREINSGAVVGFIAPVSRKFCGVCDRLRLTSDGMLRRCLASNEALDLKRFDRGVIENYLFGKLHDHMNFASVNGTEMKAIGG